MILRPIYLQQIKDFINKPQVKIITGIRRSGKSTLLHLLKAELLKMGVQEEQLLVINLESFNFPELLTAPKLYEYCRDKMIKKKIPFIGRNTRSSKLGKSSECPLSG